MGEPEEVWKQRIDQLLPYQVTTTLMHATKNPRTRFMHCLPAFHNLDTEVGRQIHEKYGLSELEVTDEVFESNASIVFTQAEIACTPSKRVGGHTRMNTQRCNLNLTSIHVD